MSVWPDWARTSSSRSCLLVGAVIIGMLYGAILALTRPGAWRSVYRTGCILPQYATGQDDLPVCVPKQTLDTSYSSNSDKNITESSDKRQESSANSSTGQAIQPSKGQLPKPQPVKPKAPQTTKQKQQANAVELTNCQKLHFASPPKLKLTVLASYPGSGNTWIRHLLQQATGLYTGSIYGSPILIKGGFAGERRRDRTVLTIKTHEYLPGSNKQYENAVLLMRNPANAMLAEFNRRKAGKVGQVPQELFSSTVWTTYLKQEIRHYRAFAMSWLKQEHRERYIVHYEDLKKDLGPVLNGLVKYLLGKDIDPEVLQCIYKNSEGKYHRKASNEEHFDPFFKPWKQKIKDLEAEVNAEVDNCLKSGRCIDYLRR